ncbi:hypothetical protein [Nonomuraea sp. NPDC049158]|uniref:hypothetical protein n=1 Tax=Nonomuraea sp. NPDC049158 TaxID=3155649 RepID=UPI0033D1AE3B
MASPFLTDLVFGVVIAGITLAFGFAVAGNSADQGYARRPLGVWGVALTLAANLALAWRRRAPLTVLGICCTTAIILHATFLAPREFTGLNILQAGIMMAVAWTFGNGTRLLVKRNRRLAHLTERLHREQDDNARRAVTEERYASPADCTTWSPTTCRSSSTRRGSPATSSAPTPPPRAARSPPSPTPAARPWAR